MTNPITHTPASHLHCLGCGQEGAYADTELCGPCEEAVERAFRKLNAARGNPLVILEGKCATCARYSPDYQGSDYQDGYGVCEGTESSWGSPDSDSPIAYGHATGDDYAMLLCKPEFACSMWTARESENVTTTALPGPL